MNRNKNLLTLYYSCKKLSKFSSAQINVFHAFSFHFCSTANSKFSFCVSLRETNCIKNQIMSLNSKSIYFGRYSLCFICFDVIIHQQLKKKFQLVELFFSHVNERRTCGLVQQLILGMLKDLIVRSRYFQSINGDPL